MNGKNPNEDELEIENIWDRTPPKKRIKSGSKGKRKELELAKVLTERFGPGFSRSIGSGNRWGQVSFLPKHAQDTFSGDLVCPSDFLWVFECKGGYNEIDLNNAFAGGIADLDVFLKQAEDESKRTGRKPMLCWKKDRRPWLSFVKKEHVPCEFDPDYVLKYRGWVAANLTDFLLQPDTFWRAGEKKK